MTPMSVERRRVVAAMQSLGWSANRNTGGLWEFRRADTNGWYTVVKVSQKGLCWALVMKHDEAFQKIIEDLWEETVRYRYTKLFKEIPDDKTPETNSG